MTERPVLAITMGDPAGVGPELCLQALAAPAVLDVCVPVLFGDAGVLRALEARGFPAGEASVVDIDRFLASPAPTGPVIVDCAAIEAAQVEPGRVSAACGAAGFRYIEESIRAALAGAVSGVVTAPIHKEALRLSGVDHPGHTEIFTALTGAERSCMMLHSDEFTVSMATTHIGYHEVPDKLSVGRIVDVIELTAAAMTRMLGRPARIGVLGLNPHAGEHGLFGQREEERFVEPALAEARKRGIEAAGPLVPDAAFTTHARGDHDAFVCLYHDQGHIPFKMLAFDTGVNTTLGLPIVRTSVDHGTAFDIAWQGKASPTSLYSAIGVAARLAKGGSD